VSQNERSIGWSPPAVGNTTRGFGLLRDRLFDGRLTPHGPGSDR
jgi:hypothetical protein